MRNMELPCDPLENEDYGPYGKLHRKSGMAEGHTIPEMKCRHVSVCGKQILLIRVSNKQPESISVCQIRVALSDPHQANVDLDHPECNNEGGDTFEIDSMEDLDEENYKNLKIEGPKSGFPMTLKTLESYSTMFKIHVKDTLEFNYTMEIDLQATMLWCLTGHTHQYLSMYRLPCLRIRKPGMVITAVSESTPTTKKTFNVNYTITNYLQDFLNVKLMWLPEKALKEARASQNTKHRRAVEKVINSVICHQPATNLGALKLGSKMSVLIAFQIQEPGLYELGQHMKLNLQYALGNSGTSDNTGTPKLGPAANQRRGSTTSTQSMPLEGQSQEGGPSLGRKGHGSKSASMSPVGSGLVPAQGIGFSQAQLLSRVDGKKGSNVSLHSMTPVPTPLASPSKGIAVFNRGAVTPSPTLARPRICMAGTLSTLSRTPSAASITSLSRTAPGTLTSLQVLKRNCQIYVLQSSSPCLDKDTKNDMTDNVAEDSMAMNKEAEIVV